MQKERPERPDTTEVFPVGDEKIRIDSDYVSQYMSSNKGAKTVISLGYAGDGRRIALDISFDDFDNWMEGNKTAIQDYYKLERDYYNWDD